MYTYLLSIPDSIKNFKDEANVKAILCGKTWRVLNQETEKTIFIFKKDGTIIVSKNGIASKSKWEYIKENKLILIELDSKTLLVHPTFVDDVLFILQQDGTEDYIIMIDENKIEKFMLVTIEAVKKYLYRVSGEEENDRIKHNREIIAERSKIRIEHSEEIKNATSKHRHTRRIVTIAFAIILILTILCAFLVGELAVPYSIFFALLMSIVWIIIYAGIDSKIDSIENQVIEKYEALKKENPIDYK